MDLEDKLRNELTAAPAEVPESLRGEAVEKLVREAPRPQNIAAMKPKKKHKALRVIGLVAASIVMLNILGLVGDAGYRFAYNRRLERKSDTAVADVVREDDPYAAVKTAVISRFISEYASRQFKSPSILVDLMRMGVKYSVAEDYAVNESGPAAAVARDDAFSADASEGKSGYSETNVQVKGVDEADFVKTDGRYIYTCDGTRVRIADTQDPSGLKLISEVRPAGNNTIRGIFLTKDRLIVAFDTYTGSGNAGGCHIYDVSDPANPAQLWRCSFDGAYVDARVTDGKLLLVSGYHVPFRYWAADVTEECETLAEACVPGYRVNGGETEKVPADSIVFPEEENCSSFTTVTMVDLTAPEAQPQTASVLTSAAQVYCSAENLYVSTYDWSRSGDATMLEKFSFASGTLTHAAEGQVPGYAFSDSSYNMDERDGYFRIAVNRDDGAAVYVFDDKLEQVGSVTGIAPGEQIYGVRFDGTRAYLVTFYQTDPLFTVDLSDPKNPLVLGELKIPGYSAYLHPVGAGLMAGVGADGTEAGLNGGAKVSLYDVTDPENPRELDVWTMDNAWTDTDPHAFVSLGENLFSVNVTAYSNADNYYSRTSDSFIALFRVENGALRQIGRYAFLPGDFSRAVFIGQRVYAVSTGGIVAYEGSTADVLAKVEYAYADSYGYGTGDVIDY